MDDGYTAYCHNIIVDAEDAIDPDLRDVATACQAFIDSQGGPGGGNAAPEARTAQTRESAVRNEPTPFV